MIECAAVRIKETGEIHVGRRHHEILHKKDKNCEMVIKDTGMSAVEQGFVTDTGEFKTREEAAKIAYGCGQIPELKSRLFSEDLY